MNLYLLILFMIVDALYDIGTGLRWISGGLFLWNRNKNENHSWGKASVKHTATFDYTSCS